MEKEHLRFIENCPTKIVERLVKWNIIDAEHAAGKKTLTEHLQAWEAHMEREMFADRHRRQSIARMERLFKECDFTYWADLNSKKIKDWVGDRRKENMSVRTANIYVATCKAFCNCTVENKGASRNPVADLSKIKKEEIRLKRRALEDDEVERLLECTEKSEKTYYFMTGKERAFVYRVALRTGIRWGELKKMLRSDFNLREESPTFTVRAEVAKNDKEATLPLVPELADELRNYFAANPRQPHEQALPIPKSDKGGKILALDLFAAGIAIVDGSGRKVDFHSLRHTYLSTLVRSGVHPKVTQELARHSCMELTMKYYTHIPESAHVEALGKLPPTKKADSKRIEDDSDDGAGAMVCNL